MGLCQETRSSGTQTKLNSWSKKWVASSEAQTLVTWLGSRWSETENQRSHLGQSPLLLLETTPDSLTSVHCLEVGKL